MSPEPKAFRGPLRRFRKVRWHSRSVRRCCRRRSLRSIAGGPGDPRRLHPAHGRWGLRGRWRRHRRHQPIERDPGPGIDSLHIRLAWIEQHVVIHAADHRWHPHSAQAPTDPRDLPRFPQERTGRRRRAPPGNSSPDGPPPQEWPATALDESLNGAPAPGTRPGLVRCAGGLRGGKRKHVISHRGEAIIDREAVPGYRLRVSARRARCGSEPVHNGWR